MSSNFLLPIARHARELLEHASEHLRGNVERDLIFALIHADNSVEIMLREYLRFKKRKSWKDLENKNFHQLLNDCRELGTIENNRNQFIAFHDIRNALYHTGTFAPRKQDVQAVIYYSKLLFNELHPNLPFKDMKAANPTKKTIKHLAEEFGQKPYVMEVDLIGRLKLFFIEQGYETRLNPKFAGTSIMADLLATRNNEAIVIEVKGGARRVFNSSIFRLAGFVDAARKTLPEKKVTGWFVAKTGFSKAARSAAGKLNIKLISGNEFEELLMPTSKATAKITRGSAEKIAIELVKSKNKNVSGVDVSSVHQKMKNWVINGAFSTRINGLPWAFNFEVRISENGEVISYNFNV